MRAVRFAKSEVARSRSFGPSTDGWTVSWLGGLPSITPSHDCAVVNARRAFEAAFEHCRRQVRSSVSGSATGGRPLDHFWELVVHRFHGAAKLPVSGLSIALPARKLSIARSRYG
jgi:hypothetical protein